MDINEQILFEIRNLNTAIERLTAVISGMQSHDHDEVPRMSVRQRNSGQAVEDRIRQARAEIERKLNSTTVLSNPGSK